MTLTRFTSALAGVAIAATAAQAQQTNATGPPTVQGAQKQSPPVVTITAQGQSNTTGIPRVPGVDKQSLPAFAGGGCVTGFTGDMTIAGGWGAFETASGKTMEVLNSGVADFTSVTTIPSSLGNVTLSPAHEKRTVGASWGSWSHGYTGEIFWTVGATSSTISMPDGTTAFDLYIEPNPFAVHNFDLTGVCDSGGSVNVTVTADGSSGASHGGFYTASGETLDRIDISGPVDYAIGELRISGDDDGGECVTGFVGDMTIAGGWGAFETASGKTMEVLVSGVADFTSVSTIPSSLGNVGLSPAHNKRTVGASWGTWSHGYTGEIFWTNGATSTTITMPDGATAFDLYIEPNPFAVHTFSLTGFCDSGGSANIMVSADGVSGASHGGFYTGAGETLDRIDITGPVDWAIGELRISGDAGGPGTNYCTVNPNSTGSPAIMSGAGSTSIAANDLTLTAEPVPNDFYVFYHGPSQTDVPFGNGRLCVEGGVTRILMPAEATGNVATTDVDTVAQGFVPGTVYFQCWFRDPAAGGANFNTSDGYAITFVP